MLSVFLKSLNGKLLFVATTIYIASVALSSVTNEYIALIGTIIYLLFGLWQWNSNKRSSIVFLSWFYRKLCPIELISFDGTRYYTLAKYESYNKMSAPVYFSSNIGHVILLEDGTIDPNSDSRYIKYWLPLNKNDRALQILKCDITT